jgi:DNA-binding PadR family transcriptional regulator
MAEKKIYQLTEEGKKELERQLDQLKADREADQLSMFDPRDPLTGSK